MNDRILLIDSSRRDRIIVMYIAEFLQHFCSAFLQRFILCAVFLIIYFCNGLLCVVFLTIYFCNGLFCAQFF